MTIAVNEGFSGDLETGEGVWGAPPPSARQQLILVNWAPQ